MAYDKLVDSAALDADLTSVADAIRAKTGTTGKLEFPDGYISNVGTLVKAEDYLAAVLNKEITEIVNHKVTQIMSDFQRDNKNLITVDLPNVKGLPANAFHNCENLKNAIFTNAITMDAGTFGNCKGLETITFESLTTISSWGYNFNQCHKLVKADFHALTGNITTCCFHTCRSLTALILRANTVVPLENKDAFDGDKQPIKDGTGYVYVPKALVDSYKTATNWSLFAAQFRAIEDYPDICG